MLIVSFSILLKFWWTSGSLKTSAQDEKSLWGVKQSSFSLEQRFKIWCASCLNQGSEFFLSTKTHSTRPRLWSCLANLSTMRESNSSYSFRHSIHKPVRFGNSSTLSRTTWSIGQVTSSLSSCNTRVFFSNDTSVRRLSSSCALSSIFLGIYNPLI